MNVHILTGPIGVGKSSLLLKWIQSSPINQFFGFISIHNRNLNEPRKLLLLPELKEIPFESVNGEVRVGRFQFLANSFVKGNEQLKHSNKESTVVIDEIGKLELLDSGFEPQLSAILLKLKCKSLIVVVRSSLFDSVIQKYPILCRAKINQGDWIPQRPIVNGLILGGGRSTRMTVPKFTLDYNGLPQYQYLEKLITKVIDGNVFINVPQENSIEINSLNLLLDAPIFANHGPISGLLTAIEKNPNSSLMVIAVDYPQVQHCHLIELFHAYLISGKSVCFINTESGFIEPLVALYSADDLQILKSYFAEGNESLSRFLNQINCIKLPMSSVGMLKSIDNLQDAQKINSKIQFNK